MADEAPARPLTPPNPAATSGTPATPAIPAAPPTRVIPTITVAPNGPYVVAGGLPVYRRRAVHSEHGEPITWQTTAALERRERYALCRCGASADKPYCDGTHARMGFEAADAVPPAYDEAAKVLGGTGITVRDDRAICVHAGFCGTRISNVWKLTPQTEESTVRAQVIAMIERCPSGALTYQLGDADVEPLLPAAVAVTDDGPLWVTGGIDVQVSGAVMEARNRMTLCRCGASDHKPLCDGSHKEAGFSDAGASPDAGAPARAGAPAAGH